MESLQASVSAVVLLAVLAAVAAFGVWMFRKGNNKASLLGRVWKLVLPLLFLVGFVMAVFNDPADLPPAEPSDSAGPRQAIKVPSFGDIVEQMPGGMAVLLGLTAVLWIVGGNALFIWQRRRAGRSWGEALNPFGPIFRDFDQKAWLLFGLLLFATLVLMSAAVSMIEDPPANAPESERSGTLLPVGQVEPLVIGRA